MRRAQFHEKAVQPRRPAQGDKTAPPAKIKAAYRRLLAAFGPQGWWPVTPRGKTAPAYVPGCYGRRGAAGIFEICAGAVLTQNTAWTNVEKALAGLRAAGLMNPGKMSSCGAAALGRAIRSSGYFRQKAGRLKAFCRRALKEHPEGFERWFSAAPAEDLRAELLSYKGVGPETADSIVLYAAGKPSFVIDAYTRRIAERLGLGRRSGYDDWKALFEPALPREVPVYNEYHALLVKLGKDFCRKSKPLCGPCPLNRICEKRVNTSGSADRPGTRKQGLAHRARLSASRPSRLRKLRPPTRFC